MSNMNMDDPGKQEAIRRGHHEYIPTMGKHGSYVPKQYNREKNEYPKMMGKWPRPQLKDFPGPEGQVKFEAAMHEWDRAMELSVVQNKAEETQWKREHAS